MEDKKEVTQEEKKEVATKNEHVNMVADFENGIYGSSDSFKMAYQMAKALSQSTIVPAHFQRNEAVSYTHLTAFSIIIPVCTFIYWIP